MEFKMATSTFSFLHRGVLVPGGFGVRGTEGKMLAITWARKQNVPYLGKILKWQCSVPYVYIDSKSNDNDMK